MLKFIIEKSKNKQFYFTINARNGQVLATSETYTRKANAKGAIKRIMNTCLSAITIDNTI